MKHYLKWSVFFFKLERVGFIVFLLITLGRIQDQRIPTDNMVFSPLWKEVDPTGSSALPGSAQYRPSWKRALESLVYRLKQDDPLTS